MFWYLGELHFVDDLVDLLFNKLVLDFDLEETFFISLDSANDIVFEEVFDDFLSELNDGFTTESSAFLFIFVHIEILHGIG